MGCRWKGAVCPGGEARAGTGAGLQPRCCRCLGSAPAKLRPPAKACSVCSPPSRDSLAMEERKLKSEVSVKCVGAVTQRRMHSATEHVSRQVQLELGQRGKRKSSFTFPPLPAVLNHTASGSRLLPARHEAWGSGISAARHVLLRAPSSQAPRLSHSEQLTSFRTRLQFPSVNCIPCSAHRPGDDSEAEQASRLQVSSQKGNGSDHAASLSNPSVPSRMHARYTQTLH